MLIEKILDRGIEKLTVSQIMEITKSLGRATNTHKGGFGFYAEMEKHVKNLLFQGKMDFESLIKVVEHLLPANIGSNEFHAELEQFMIHNFTTDNL